MEYFRARVIESSKFRKSVVGSGWRAKGAIRLGQLIAIDPKIQLGLGELATGLGPGFNGLDGLLGINR